MMLGGSVWISGGLFSELQIALMLFWSDFLGELEVTFSVSHAPISEFLAH